MFITFKKHLMCCCVGAFKQASAPGCAVPVVLNGQHPRISSASLRYFSSTGILDQTKAHGQRAGRLTRHSLSMRRWESIQGLRSEQTVSTLQSRSNSDSPLYSSCQQITLDKRPCTSPSNLPWMLPESSSVTQSASQSAQITSRWQKCTSFLWSLPIFCTIPKMKEHLLTLCLSPQCLCPT